MRVGVGRGRGLGSALRLGLRLGIGLRTSVRAQACWRAPKHHNTKARAPRTEPAPRLGVAGTLQMAGLAHLDATGQGQFLPFKQWVVTPEARVRFSSPRPCLLVRSS